jgi:hypothetical protein
VQNKIDDLISNLSFSIQKKLYVLLRSDETVIKDMRILAVDHIHPQDDQYKLLVDFVLSLPLEHV